MMQFFADTLSSLKGDIQVIDSKLIMDGLRFSSPLTAMQLTAIYRSVRPDHLYAYLDFHLLHIEVQDLLSAIPPLQEFMPMLGSVRGKGEFHLVAEVYMWDDYSIKIPTLRGAASINASEITLMDGEMFTQMLDEMGKIGGMKAKNLFKNFIFDPAKGVKFDNLSAEFVAFRDEITVYPFLLSIDKYKAVLGGHHNIDMNYDYTLSLVESPLPFRMSIEVADKGKGAEFSKFKLKAENMDVYRPESRKAVESQTMQLRKIIREATASTVRPWDEEDLKRMEEAK